MGSITVHVKQQNTSASEGVARTHQVIIDRPVAKGGGDLGAMGGEHLLIALGGCFMSNLLEAIRTRSLPIRDISVEIIGETADSPARYTAIQMRVTGKYPDPAEMEKLVTIAERACLVANTLRNAVTLTISVGDA